MDWAGAPGALVCLAYIPVGGIGVLNTHQSVLILLRTLFAEMSWRVPSPVW